MEPAFPSSLLKSAIPSTHPLFSLAIAPTPLAPTPVISKVPFTLSTDIQIVPTELDSHPNDQGTIGVVAENVQVQEDDLVSTKLEIIDTVPLASINVENEATGVNGHVSTSNSVLGASTAVTQVYTYIYICICTCIYMHILIHTYIYVYV
jgi:hypothetical protein